MIKIFDDGSNSFIRFEASVEDLDNLAGYGPTEKDAILDLKKQIQYISFKLLNVDYSKVIYVNEDGIELKG